MIHLLKSINLFILPNRVNRIKYVATAGFYFSVMLCIMLCTPQFSEMPGVIFTANLFLLRIKRLHDFNCSGWLSLLVFFHNRWDLGRDNLYYSWH
jgi:uncharacterized membrane protein YhaH (DUF805 family)